MSLKKEHSCYYTIYNNNLFSFQRGLDAMECLSFLVGSAYKTFCKKEYIFTIFVDIKGAFDSEHTPTLISHLATLYIPIPLCNFIFLLSSHRSLKFSSSFGIIKYLLKTDLHTEVERLTLARRYLTFIPRYITYMSIFVVFRYSDPFVRWWYCFFF